MKYYPLDAYDVSHYNMSHCDIIHDERIVMSRGHHNIHEFMKAVRAKDFCHPMCVPVHRWAKLVDDSTSDNWICVFVKEEIIGAFPVTYAWECKKSESYEVKYSS